MRDIKFRVWNTYNMSMRYIPSIYCRMYEYESLPLMQYTGLKDKHGKEIYEGDILKSHEHIGTVVYSQDSFKIKNRNGHHTIITIGLFRKVLGNIYEDEASLYE